MIFTIISKQRTGKFAPPVCLKILVRGISGVYENFWIVGKFKPHCIFVNARKFRKGTLCDIID